MQHPRGQHLAKGCPVTLNHKGLCRCSGSLVALLEKPGQWLQGQLQMSLRLH